MCYPITISTLVLCLCLSLSGSFSCFTIRNGALSNHGRGGAVVFVRSQSTTLNQSLRSDSDSDQSVQRLDIIVVSKMRMEASELTGAVAPSSALFETRKGEEEEEEEYEAAACDEQCSSTTTSSSIGKDSDGDVSSETESAENEAQSAYNGPLDMMDSLQEVLPIRRGISKFYNGKSKSFTSLADASSSPSVKDIAKPENAYTRRRRNLMAFNHVWDKNRNFPLRSNSGGISKRTISSSKSALALAFAMNYDSSSSCTSEDSTSRSPPPLPPLHPRIRVSSASAGPSSPLQQNFSAWRSFSLADLQHCANAATIKMPSSSLGNQAANLS